MAYWKENVNLTIRSLQARRDFLRTVLTKIETAIGAMQFLVSSDDQIPTLPAPEETETTISQDIDEAASFLEKAVAEARGKRNGGLPAKRRRKSHATPIFKGLRGWCINYLQKNGVLIVKEAAKELYTSPGIHHKSPVVSTQVLRDTLKRSPDLFRRINSHTFKLQEEYARAISG